MDVCAFLMRLTVAMIAATSIAWGQVSSVQLRKSLRYVQTSSTAAALDSVRNSSFHADVDGTGIGSIAPPAISGPFNVAALGAAHNGGLLVYNAVDGGWRYGPQGTDFAAASRQELDSLFGNGTYTFTVNGAAVPVTLAGDAYPVRPLLTLDGGAWVDGKYVIDPARPLTITTSPFAEYGTHRNDVICVFFKGQGFVPPSQSVITECPGQRQRASEVPGVNSLTVTVPPTSLAAGEEYELRATFAAIVDSRSVTALPGSSNTARYTATTVVRIKASVPVFPMTVTVSIGPTISSASAQIQYRPQDVNSVGSVYAFAVAPMTITRGLAASDMPLRMNAKVNKADTAVACVLAQLNAGGQLQQVSASGMAAYASGVLSSQGQAVTILNGVPTINIAGATFYVGYGTSAASMLNNGVNRSAFTVPGAAGTCQPQPPQTGWWWNPAEGGRGFSLEVRGNSLFFASFLYDASGRSTWLAASGPTSLDGSLFTSQLLSFANGQTLDGAWKARGPAAQNGAVTLAFNDATRGTLVWPGGSIPIERFDIVANGHTLAPQANQPEAGWWWNPQEDGRGFFLEWQGGRAFVAGYMYDANGNPVWYLSQPATPNAQMLQGNWELYASGQSLTGTYKAPTVSNANVAPVTITFQGPDTGLMTLPGGRTTQITRFRF